MAEEIKEVESTETEEATVEETQEMGESEESEVVEPTESDVTAGEGETDFHKQELDRIKSRLGIKIDKERKEKNFWKEKAEKGLSSEDVEKIVSEKVSIIRKELYENRADEIANRLSSSPEERELIMYHYQNSIISSGNIDDDMDRAKALANYKKQESRISELKKSALSKQSRAGTSDAGAPNIPQPKVKFTKDIIEAARRVGVTPEDFIKKMNE